MSALSNLKKWAMGNSFGLLILLLFSIVSRKANSIFLNAFFSEITSSQMYLGYLSCRVIMYCILIVVEYLMIISVYAIVVKKYGKLSKKGIVSLVASCFVCYVLTTVALNLLSGSLNLGFTFWITNIKGFLGFPYLLADLSSIINQIANIVAGNVIVGVVGFIEKSLGLVLDMERVACICWLIINDKRLKTEADS